MALTLRAEALITRTLIHAAKMRGDDKELDKLYIKRDSIQSRCTKHNFVMYHGECVCYNCLLPKE